MSPKETEQPDHTSPCEFTKATRWYLVTIAAVFFTLVLASLGFFSSRLEQQPRLSSDNKSDISDFDKRQEVLTREVAIRLDGIEKALQEIKHEIKNKP